MSIEARMIVLRHLLAGGLMAMTAAMAGVARAVEAETAGNSATTPAARVPLMLETRPQYWFGVAVENIPPTIAKQLKLKNDQGLMVIAVFPNSPAERAGLKSEDLLIELDGSPLTSQDDLARAANTNRTPRTEGERQIPTGLMKRSKITFLREGDRKTVNLMPASRPEGMLVVGNNLENFMPHADHANGATGSDAPGGARSGRGPGAPLEVRNIVLPNGVAAQVGPGYTVELNGGQASTVMVRSIRQLMSKGETVVLSQETDPSGNVKNTITVGGKAYAVAPSTVPDLPADLKPLAEQMLLSMPALPPRPSVPDLPAVAPPAASAADPPAPAPAPPASATLDERMNVLERQNSELLRQLDDLRNLLKENHRPAPATDAAEH
jgi:hypothetical protein